MTPTPIEQSEILIQQAKECSRQFRFDQALEIYEQALHLPRLQETPEGGCQWARIQINKGAVLHRSGNLLLAKEAWLKALSQPRDLEGMDFLQCVASGYILGLVGPHSPEWIKGWIQILGRFSSSLDSRIPGKLFEISFGREWEFDGLKPGLHEFFLSLGGIYPSLETGALPLISWIYHSLTPLEKEKVLPYWRNAPKDWGRNLWGNKGPWPVLAFEAQWIQSRGKLEDQERLSKRWSRSTSTLIRWPELQFSRHPRRSVVEIADGSPPWVFFSDGTVAQGFEILPARGEFLSLDVRGSFWGGIRRGEPKVLELGTPEGVQHYPLLEPSSLCAIGPEGEWVVLGASGTFASSGNHFKGDLTEAPFGLRRIFWMKNGLLALGDEGQLGFLEKDGSKEWKAFGSERILWLRPHPQGKYFALSSGKGGEIWEWTKAAPTSISKSPEDWDDARWQESNLWVFSSRSYGQFTLGKNKWTRTELNGLIHGLWPVENQQILLADRKGRWKIDPGEWHPGHGNWINGFALRGESYWTGDLEGQVLEWTTQGRVIRSFGPQKTLSFLWIDENTYVTFHPTYLQVQTITGKKNYHYGHDRPLTAFLVENKKIWIGDTGGNLVHLDALAQVIKTYPLGLGGITALVEGQNTLGVGGALGGWGVLDRKGLWTIWGEEGVSAICSWGQGWVIGTPEGKMKYYSAPGEGVFWPEVHKGAVMALVVQNDELFSAGADGRVLVWTGTGQLSEILRREKTAVWDLKPAGRVLLGRTEESDFPLWNLPGTGGVTMGQGHRMKLTSLDNHGLLCATGGAEGWVKLWTLPDLAPLVRFDLKEPIARVAFSPQGTKLLAYTVKGSWSLWDLGPAWEHLLP